MFMIILVALAVIVASLVLNTAFKLYNNYKKVSHIPGTFQLTFTPWRIPFISPVWYLGNVDTIVDNVKKYGDAENKIMRITFPEANLVLVSDPAMLKEFFLTKGNTFDKSSYVYEMFNVYGESILSATDTETWRKHFKVVSPAFSPMNLQYMCKVCIESCKLLFNRWESRLQGKEYFILDLSDFPDITLDVLGNSAFGIDFGTFSGEHNTSESKFRRAMEKVISHQFLIRRFFLEMPWLCKLLETVTGTGEATKFCGDYLDKVIKERTELVKNYTASTTDDEKKHDVFTLLVEANILDKQLTDGELKSNALIFSTAGHETTATLLKWTFYEISKRPDVQNRMYQEIMEKIGDRPIEYDDFGKMDYIYSTILEVLRFNPPVVWVSRECNKSTTIGGYHIPKGTRVNALIKQTHSNDKLWKNPQEFNPERLFNNPELRDKVQQDMSFIGFSMGNRKCIGYKFALLEAMMLICTFLKSYEFKLENDESVDPVLPKKGIVNVPGDNMRIRVFHRTN